MNLRTLEQAMGWFVPPRGGIDGGEAVMAKLARNIQRGWP